MQKSSISRININNIHYNVIKCIQYVKLLCYYIYNNSEEMIIMAQTNLNIRMDENLKKQFDAFCSDVGMSMTTAICIFAKAVVREHRIPFEIKTDSDTFYSADNIER